jgi:hypothetical protein
VTWTQEIEAMARLPWSALLAFSTFVAAADATAQNKCTATGQMAGQAFNLTYCEVALYEGSPGVTIWFSSTPITDQERDVFQRSSYADDFKKGRTMVHLAFCPGGGTAVPSPKAAKNVELGFKHATVMDLGTQDQWVFDPAKDKQINFESLSGDLKKGGKLAGKVTGAIANKKPPFTWDLAFDLVLPQRAAGAGPGC